MKIIRLMTIMAAALAAAGCISTSDFEAEQQRVAELQEELANIKRTASSKEEVENVNTRVVAEVDKLLKSNAALIAKVADIEERIQSTQGGIEQSTYQMERVAQQLAQAQRDIEDLRARLTAMQSVPAAPATEATGEAATSEVTVPAPVAPSVDPTQAYQAAYRDYQRGNFDLAIEGFREFLAGNANSHLADNAAYWIGESLFSQKKYREAIEQFDSVVTRYPRSEKVPGALLKKGYAYINIGERGPGVVQLQYVLHEHPRSQEASLARQKLRQLGIETQ